MSLFDNDQKKSAAPLAENVSWFTKLAQGRALLTLQQIWAAIIFFWGGG